MPEQEIKQKTIESFFADHQIEDSDQKAKLLPLLTDIVYEYNTNVVKYEKEQDQYRKEQFLRSIKELEEKIAEIIKEETTK